MDGDSMDIDNSAYAQEVRQLQTVSAKKRTYEAFAADNINSIKARMTPYQLDRNKPRSKPIVCSNVVHTTMHGRPVVMMPPATPMRRIRGMFTCVIAASLGLLGHFWAYITGQYKQEIIAVETDLSGRKRRAVSGDIIPVPSPSSSRNSSATSSSDPILAKRNPSTTPSHKPSAARRLSKLPSSSSPKSAKRSSPEPPSSPKSYTTELPGSFPDTELSLTNIEVMTPPDSRPGSSQSQSKPEVPAMAHTSTHPSSSQSQSKQEVPAMAHTSTQQADTRPGSSQSHSKPEDPQMGTTSTQQATENTSSQKLAASAQQTATASSSSASLPPQKFASPPPRTQVVRPQANLKPPPVRRVKAPVRAPHEFNPAMYPESKYDRYERLTAHKRSENLAVRSNAEKDENVGKLIDRARRSVHFSPTKQQLKDAQKEYDDHVAHGAARRYQKREQVRREAEEQAQLAAAWELEQARFAAAQEWEKVRLAAEQKAEEDRLAAEQADINRQIEEHQREFGDYLNSAQWDKDIDKLDRLLALDPDFKDDTVPEIAITTTGDAQAHDEINLAVKELIATTTRGVAAITTKSSDEELAEKAAATTLDEEAARAEDEAQRLLAERAAHQHMQALADAPAAKHALRQTFIRPLEEEWKNRVDNAMATANARQILLTATDGTELTRYDFGTVLPQKGTTDSPHGWLNDEIINGFLQTIISAKQEQQGYVRGANNVPAYAAFNSMWCNNVKKSGMQGIRSWSRRKGISGEKLLKAQKIFFPINTGAHWMLLIINPLNKTIEFLDSLHQGGAQWFQRARDWLQMELGAKYVAADWTDLRTSRSEMQENQDDCGVFVCINALAAAKGVDYKEVKAHRMQEARKMMVAVLLNGGLKGDWGL